MGRDATTAESIASPCFEGGASTAENTSFGSGVPRRGEIRRGVESFSYLIPSLLRPHFSRPTLPKSLLFRLKSGFKGSCACTSAGILCGRFSTCV
eukprot:1277192-Pleurochrysis_carterae.AAC.1